jgi:hypothetical protein
VVAPPELHRQTISTPIHDASLTGEIRAPASAIAPMRLDERRIIGHRAMLELDTPNLIVNLGIGMPEVLCAHSLLVCPMLHAENAIFANQGQQRLSWVHAWAHLVCCICLVCTCIRVFMVVNNHHRRIT